MILHDICQAKHRLIGEGGSLLKSGGAVKAKKRRQKMRAAGAMLTFDGDTVELSKRKNSHCVAFSLHLLRI